ncbi:MAG TPA: shikimate dehydrogenase [Roseimicrobium sp.]|nr:shikimate dehydrogenase [Roseimicrobium sp.]
MATLAFEVVRRIPYNRPVSATVFHPLDASTRYCAVYGHPVAHSASPAMHNAGLDALGLTGWRYIAFDVHPDELAAAINGARAMKFSGLNLTVPHKLLALPLMDVLDESAKKWGAVNTVRFETQDADGNWVALGQVPASAVNRIRSVGYNTDADAIVRSIREDLGLELRGKSVFLLGAGGAGRVAAMKVAEQGVRELHLLNRTRSKAEAVADEIAVLYPGVSTKIGYPDQPVDLVLNATSMGLKAEDPLPFEETLFSLRSARHAYDMIYRPAETRFLKLAKESGCKTANGIGMLLYQGASAQELWTGKPAAISVMRSALVKHVYG